MSVNIITTRRVVWGLVFLLWLGVSVVIFSYATLLNTKELSTYELFLTLRLGYAMMEDNEKGYNFTIRHKHKEVKEIEPEEYFIDISGTYATVINATNDPLAEYRRAITNSSRLHPVIGIITSNRLTYLLRLLDNLLNELKADPKLIFILDDGTVSVEKEVKSLGVNYRSFHTHIPIGESDPRIKHMNKHYLSLFNFFLFAKKSQTKFFANYFNVELSCNL
eukprot:TRINITY_DN13864_c0_g2_i1.p1 TRINITY_DN13864_c0_g2~~TRINITY_DN13864_c0_g2_i1.p1  ORF type:complete len:221 (-),score=27.46 TRINITY_DN13864_c0_g2_i1:80-742(-)